MPKIKVHILNFHGGNSHLEVLLQNISDDPIRSYIINQWNPANKKFANYSRNDYLKRASSTFSFEIEADPEEIVKAWREHQKETEPTASILYNNCADAVQWFLNKYAHIPSSRPFAFPMSVNHLIFGISVPSFLPIGITLPGRVMDNAKFYVNIKNKIDPMPKRSDLALKLTIAVGVATIGLSIVGIMAASIFLTGGLSALVIAGCIVAGALATHGFFKSANTLAARKMMKSNSLLKSTDPVQTSPPSLAPTASSAAA